MHQRANSITANPLATHSHPTQTSRSPDRNLPSFLYASPSEMHAKKSVGNLFPRVDTKAKSRHRFYSLFSEGKVQRRYGRNLGLIFMKLSIAQLAAPLLCV